MQRRMREALGYTADFRGKRFVIKLDDQVSERAEELGVTSDVRLLHHMGIYPVVAHTKDNLNLAEWPSLGGCMEACAISDRLMVVRALQNGRVPLLYCGAGSDPASDEAVTDLAIHLGADKLLFLTYLDGLYASGRLVRQCTIHEAQERLRSENDVGKKGLLGAKIQCAIRACQAGVARVHIASGLKEDALIGEVFSAEGVGTMFYIGSRYREIRSAVVADCESIRDILRDAGLVPLPTYAEVLAQREHFWVLTADDHVQACVMLFPHYEAATLEVLYLAASGASETPEVREEMMGHAFTVARQASCRFVFLRGATQDVLFCLSPWFTKFEFRQTRLAHIPNGASLGAITEKVWIRDVQP